MWLEVSPNQETLAIGSVKEIRLYNVKDNKHLAILEGSTYEEDIFGFVSASINCTFSPDGKYLAYRWENSVKIYNVNQGHDEKAITLNDGQNPRTITWSPDSQRILVGCFKDHIQVYTMNADSS